jgi:hypothetical protein
MLPIVKKCSRRTPSTSNTTPMAKGGECLRASTSTLQENHASMWTHPSRPSTH